MSTTVSVSFEIRYKAPRSALTRLIVVGGPPELGALNLSKKRFFQSFEAQTKRKFEKWLSGQAKLSDGDLSDSELDFSDDEDISLPREKISKDERRNQVLTFLEETFAVLEEDPNDEEIENLWATPMPVEFKSLKPGQVFSYAYFVWDCDGNRVWEFEKFHEARTLQIPESKISSWVARAKAFGSRQCELKPAPTYKHDSDLEVHKAGLDAFVVSRRAPVHVESDEDDDDDDSF